MSDKSKEYTLKDMDHAIKKALDAVIKKARSEPGVILEIDTKGPEHGETIKEVSSWLFKGQ